MGRPTLGASPTQRLQMKITEDEVAAINDYRFANRIATLSEAVRQLVAKGLQATSATEAQ
ncbi:hypothetical protein [Aureimonas psammosilenae]|uniref:hypothetical protein n=1 Tax=Aureimonas psammosilenae TaxID=2495496 RepID=UPI00126137CD|nr:hypothetical protein [Aureimonas psammosilenae]